MCKKCVIARADKRNSREQEEGNADFLKSELARLTATIKHLESKIEKLEERK